ncbi:hypothetical protein IAQ61_010021 [Plenodomus lingam]|uniref:uncharacterized protein n=1 Tax=Leptosphaeria maculans TaxID=5022 RepID=UPI00332C96C0|nr:hypothetical protein IAQ61_010021 [Plenodomus lingam]
MNQGLLMCINKFAGNEQCIRTIKLLFKIPLAFVHDKQGHFIDDFSLLDDNDMVVVTTGYFESPINMWTRELQQGPQTDAWMALTRPQRRAYMQNLPCRCCKGNHTKTTLTLPIHVIRSSISEILASGLSILSPMPASTAEATHARVIEESWGQTINDFMGTIGLMRPEVAMKSWHPALMATLALLADATTGQVQTVQEATMRVIGRRSRASGSIVVSTTDLRRVIEEITKGEVYFEDDEEKEEQRRNTGDVRDGYDEYGHLDLSDFDWCGI